MTNHTQESGLGLNFTQRVLHYQMFSPEPWNGFAAVAETYNAFDADDERREIFLEGPQFDLDDGEPVCERPGCVFAPGQPRTEANIIDGVRLVFTVDIADPTQAGEGEGTRILKFSPDPDRVQQEAGNDFTWFRLAEMYLIKAEALNELTPGSAEALDLVNTLRARVFDPDEPLGAIDRTAILAERQFELTGEGKRRQDLIRHGLFTQAWTHKPASPAHVVLLPIPQPQLDANPELVQNPGY